MSEPLYPLFLRLAGRSVLVVGAGALATQKIRELLQAGATITVVAPVASAEVQAWAADRQIAWHARTFKPSDVNGRYLVVAAAADPAVHAEVCERAERQSTFAVALDAPRFGSAFFGSIVDRAPLLFAISSHGQAPALTRLLRELIEHVLPNDDVVRRARALRVRWREERMPIGARFDALVRELSHSTA